MKKRGMSLLELMFVVAFTSLIGVFLYQIYVTLQKSTRFIQTTNFLNSEILSFYFHFKEDIKYIYHPYIFDFYQNAFYIKHKRDTKKKEGESSQAKQIDQTSSSSNDKQKEKEKKEEEKLLKKIEYAKLFFPQYSKTEDECTLSFVSTRTVLTKKEGEERTKIIYLFKKDGNNLWSIFRSEEKIDPEQKEKETSKPRYHLLLKNIEDLKINFFIPNIHFKDLKEQKEIEDVFIKWQKEPEYNKQDVFQIPSIEDDELFHSFFYPFAIECSGILIGPDKVKKKEFKFLLDIKNSRFVIEFFFMILETFKKQEDEENKKKKQPGNTNEQVV